MVRQKLLTSDTRSRNRRRLRSGGFLCLLLLLAGAGAADARRYADTFSTGDYSGNDGDAAWAQDWREWGESNGPADPFLSVVDSAHGIDGRTFLMGRESGSSFYMSTRGVSRWCDLTGVAIATLSFDYRCRAANGQIRIYGSSDGGGSWSMIDAIDLDGSDTATAHMSLDLTPFISSQTTFSFYGSLSTEFWDPDGGLYIDNVEVLAHEASELTDLSLALEADPVNPAEGEEVAAVLELTNTGNPVTGIEVSVSVPAGMTLVDDTADCGSWDGGVWRIESMEDGQTCRLELVLTPDAGTAGTGIELKGEITALDGVDTDDTNDGVSEILSVSALTFEMAVGRYTGNGGGQSIGDAGFAPDLVIVKADDAENSVAASRTMETGYSRILPDYNSAVGQRIVSLDDAGFTVGDASEVNRYGVRYDWIAFKSAAGAMRVGSYRGDGTDGREIAGLGFSPDYVMLLPREGGLPCHRFATQSGDVSLTFDGSGPVANRIQDFTGDGFEVGGDDAVNADGRDYDYIAWRAQTARMTVGTYVGNGQDNVDIHQTDFLPEYVLIRGEQSNWGAHRSQPAAEGDITMRYGAANHTANHIQTLRDDGFQIGSNNRINRNGVVFHWAAFANAPPNADLNLALTVTDYTPAEGQEIVFTLTLGNGGPEKGMGVETTLPLPAGLSFVSAAPERGGYDSITGIWNPDEIAVGEQLRLDVTATVDGGTAGQVISNTAAITAADLPDYNGDNDTARLDLIVGSEGAYELTAVADTHLEEGYPDDNKGDERELKCRLKTNDTKRSVIRFDLSGIHAGLTVEEAWLQLYVTRMDDSGDPVRVHRVTDDWEELTATWNDTGADFDPTARGSFLPEAIGLVAVDVTALAAEWVSGERSNQGLMLLATSDDEESKYGSRDNDAEIKRPRLHVVTNGLADLALAKVVDAATPDEGDLITFTLTVTNEGPHAAAGIRILDQLPAGLTYQSSSASHGVYNSGSGLWNLGALPATDEATLTLSAWVDAGQGGATIENSATVTSVEQYDPVPENDTAAAAVTVQLADLRVEKSVDEPAPDVGDEIVYTVTVTNDGPDPATGVAILDDLPAGLTPVTIVPSKGSYDSGGSTWILGDLADGDAATLVATMTVSADSAGAELTNTASVSAADQADHNGANDAASVAIDIQAADLDVTMTVDEPAPEAGEVVRYTITVLNNGPDAAAGIALADTLPAGLTWQSDNATQGDYDEATGIWTLGDLADGAAASLTVDALVETSAAGAAPVNTAEITAAAPFDTDPANNSAAAAVDVPGADLHVTKTVDDGAPLEGGEIAYTVAVTNLGPDAAGGVLIADPLPAGVTFQSADATRGVYDDGTGVWTLGELAADAADTLTLVATVDMGTGDTVVTNTAAIAASSVADSAAANNTASADIGIGATDADLALTKGVNDADPTAGELIVFQISLENLGPDAATHIEVTDQLPAGLAFVSAGPSTGTYDQESGLWAVNSLGVSASAALQISARPLTGAIGSVIVNEAEIVSADQSDPDADNNLDTAAVTVRGADLALTADADDTAPAVGDTVAVTYTLTNAGPDAVNGITASAPLPEGLTPIAATPEQGAYDAGSGLWTVGELPLSGQTTLTLELSVNGDQASRDISCGIAVATAGLADPDPANDAASVLLAVADPPAADIAVGLTVNDATPASGQEILFTVTAGNLGPQPAQGVAIEAELPLGLTLRASAPTQGSYNGETGLWSVGNLAPDTSASLELAATVDGYLEEGARITTRAERTESTPADPAAANDAAEADVVVTVAEAVFVTGFQSGGSLRPGLGSQTAVLTLELLNNTGEPDTLRGLTLHNLAQGEGTQAQLDASWNELTLKRPIGIGVNDIVIDRATLVFVEGACRIDDLDVALTPEEPVVLKVYCGASLTARDGDVLDLGLVDETDLELAWGSPLDATWPLSPAETFVVDGLTAQQIAIEPLGTVYLRTDSERNLVFETVLPGNGYADDTLNKINLVNRGGADHDDIERMELWVDDGDGAAEIAGDDDLLTQLYYTGSRWERSGLSQPVPADGLRVYVTVDIAELATEGRTVHLGFPGDESDTALGMESGNDGPLDADRMSPDVHIISAENRVALSANILSDDEVRPGAQRVLALQLQASNSYDAARTLQGLTLTNACVGAGTTAQLGASVARLRLWDDSANPDVFDDAATDTLLATAYFTGDGETATFGAFNWVLPPGGLQRNLFVTVDVSQDRSADGDLLGLELAALGDLAFASQTVVAAAWPLDSERRLLVDGMIAAQVVNYGAPQITLGQNEGPVLALDIGVPANGYAQDWLQHLTVVNAGTALPSAINELHLWRDDGNGVFDNGAPDIDLYPLAESGGEWQSRLFSNLVDVGGARLFVGLSASATLDSSVTVRLYVPENGITMESGNSGPIDEIIMNAESQLLSKAPLLATLAVEPSGSTVGQTVRVSMIVRNIGDEGIHTIAPDPLLPDGEGVLTLLGGPTPAVIDLVDVDVDTFRWEYTAVAAGEVALSGGAAGIGGDTGLDRLALATSSNTHAIFVQAENLDLIYSESMPFSINQGQTDIVPLHLTFSNEAGEEASAVHLRSLEVELRNTADTGIVPADLLAAIVVKEGAHEYLRKTGFETSGFTSTLDLTSYVQISNQEPVTLALQLDVLPATTVPDFQVRIASAGSFECVDVTSGAPVEVALGEGAFPIASDFAHVGAQPTRLDVSLPERDDLRVSRGQADVPLLDLEFDNAGIDEITSSIRVTRFAVGLTDSLGAALPAIGDWLTHIRLAGSEDTYLDIPITNEADSILHLDLASQLIVPVNEPVDLRLSGAIAADAPPGGLRMALLSDSLMTARDVITGDSVAVAYETAAPLGHAIAIENPADTLLVERTGGLPPALIVGEQDLDALSLRLIHPGEAGDARIRCDGVVIHCRRGGDILPPGPVIDRVSVLWNGASQALLTDLSDVDGFFRAPLPGLLLEPGDSVLVDVRIDLEATASTGGIELRSDAADWELFDQNTDDAIVLAPVAGQALPLSSGPSWLESPARNLYVGLESLLPAVLAADGNDLPFGNLALDNDAEAGSGDILVDHLVIRASDRAGAEQPIGRMATRVSAYLEGELWAECGDIHADSLTATLTAGQILAVEPEAPVELELRVTLRSDGAAADQQSLRLGLLESDIGVVQPANPLLSVDVQGDAGQVFPLWTRQGNFTALTLGGSFSNFPNPFAAGAEESRFTFYLERPARVTLKMWTPRGELVRTILNAEERDAGLCLDDLWDGRNGEERVVANGVFLAELEVEYLDGGGERLLRKVAVVR